MRDFRRREQWSEGQLNAAAFLLHELYGACDLTALLLGELDCRQSSTGRECHLSSVLLSRPDLTLESPATS